MIRRLTHWLKRHSRSYDLTAPSRHLDVHFASADNGDADSLIEPALAVARNRVRYEVRNNTYAKGIVDTLANDLVGTGPRLQLKTENPTFNRAAEKRWSDWIERCDATGRMDLADLLRLAVFQLCESGEVFIHIYYDPSAGRADGESLRLLMIEPDRVNSPAGMIYNDNIHQGIETDSAGRPVRYYVQKTHPGSAAGPLGGSLGEYEQVPAEQMIHLARIDRPGQTRGMPWLTPALPLFAHMRRYTLAVITAAEKAADMAAVLESDAPIGETQDVEEFETLDIERGSLMTLPAGWRMSQFRAEQPVDTYAMFKAEIINEIARCVSMPYNVAAANSSSYNYASGRLDKQVYYRQLDVVRHWLAKHLLDRVLSLWLAEAVLLDPAMDAAPPVGRAKVDWYWPGSEHVDPAKEASAQDTRLKNYSTTYAAEYARQGKDWLMEFEQIAAEKEAMETLGITPKDVIDHDPTTEQTDPDDAEEDDKDDRRAAQRLRVAR